MTRMSRRHRGRNRSSYQNCHQSGQSIFLQTFDSPLPYRWDWRLSPRRFLPCPPMRPEPTETLRRAFPPSPGRPWEPRSDRRSFRAPSWWTRSISAGSALATRCGTNKSAIPAPTDASLTTEFAATERRGGIPSWGLCASPLRSRSWTSAWSRSSWTRPWMRRRTTHWWKEAAAAVTTPLWIGPLSAAWSTRPGLGWNPCLIER
mmetsp:Transcript_8462/g.25056  ORF Transcript_8462/g.25056 Transcript_8462/m.25056 type:complete len:204 (+) Transcript_8462:5607-6218(+)